MNGVAATSGEGAEQLLKDGISHSGVFTKHLLMRWIGYPTSGERAEQHLTDGVYHFC
jgi:hypothetical protein